MNSILGYMARGDWRRAHVLCESILRAQPDCAQAWYLFSQVKLELGALQQAVACVQRARSLEPDNPQFLLHLAFTLAHNGDQQGALDALAGAHLAAPSAADSALMGTVLSLCNEYELAAPLFRRATEQDKKEPGHWLNLALAHRALGHSAAADDCCDRAIALGDVPQAHYLRSEVSTQSAASNHIPTLRARLRDEHLSVRDRVYLLFALGKELEDIGAYADAFKAFEAATSSHRSMLGYRVESDLAVLDALMAQHTKASLSRLSQGPIDHRPVFIVGLPRSGTTLLERIFQAHTQVISRGERNDLALEISAQGRALSGLKQLSPVDLVDASLQINTTELGQRYLQRVMSGADGAARVIDKMPINYLYCGLIQRALPGARIIAVRRAPMDSCFAAWKSLLLGPYGFTYDFADMARYYAGFERLLEHWSQCLPESVYREVDYEDLVTQTGQTVQELCHFLDIRWEPAMLDFHRSSAATVTASAAQVRQPIYASSVGKWRHYAADLAPLEQALIREGVFDSASPQAESAIETIG